MTDQKPDKKPKPRRSGQVIERGEDKFLIRVFVRKDGNGKRHWHSETFHGRRKDAEARARDLLQKVRTGEPLRADNSQFNAFLDEWERSHPDLTEVSIENYERTLRTYVRPKLGGMMLSRIVAGNIQSLYDDLRADNLSGTTIAHVHRLLRSVFKLAVLRKRIRDNPMDGVKSPSGKKLAQEQRRKREAKVMTPDQARAFLQAADSTPYGALFALAFHTGCRPGELLGLRWSDFNAAQAVIHIRMGMHWRKSDDPRGAWYLDELKTESSRRDLRLDAETVERLKAHRKRQLEDRLKAGKDWQDFDFVFCDEVGEPYTRSRLQYHCKRILEAAGLPMGFSPYSARHSSATWMIEQGISVKTVAGRLGHSDVTTTLRHYVHSTEGMDAQAVEVLTRAVKGEK